MVRNPCVQLEAGTPALLNVTGLLRGADRVFLLEGCPLIRYDIALWPLLVLLPLAVCGSQ